MYRAGFERRSRSVGITRQVAVVGAIALIVCLSIAASVPDDSMAAVQPAGASDSACATSVIDGTIPSWASAGFTPSTYRMHYQLGSAHKIVALLWKFPLLSPPAKSVANKILWVSHLPTDGSTLMISAQRIVQRRPVGSIVHRSIAGGPGPSYVNLPASGCWHLDLRWSGYSDSMDLQYVAQ
jgi:hypothetical protein